MAKAKKSKSKGKKVEKIGTVDTVAQFNSFMFNVFEFGRKLSAFECRLCDSAAIELRAENYSCLADVITEVPSSLHDLAATMNDMLRSIEYTLFGTEYILRIDTLSPTGMFFDDLSASLNAFDGVLADVARIDHVFCGDTYEQTLDHYELQSFQSIPQALQELQEKMFEADKALNKMLRQIFGE